MTSRVWKSSDDKILPVAVEYCFLHYFKFYSYNFVTVLHTHVASTKLNGRN